MSARFQEKRAADATHMWSLSLTPYTSLSRSYLPALFQPQSITSKRILIFIKIIKTCGKAQSKNVAFKSDICIPCKSPAENGGLHKVEYIGYNILYYYKAGINSSAIKQGMGAA